MGSSRRRDSGDIFDVPNLVVEEIQRIFLKNIFYPCVLYTCVLVKNDVSLKNLEHELNRNSLD